MITHTPARILGYIRSNGQARVKDLVTHLNLGSVAIHRQLKRLLDQGKLTKAGTPPLVFYRLAAPSTPEQQLQDPSATNLLDTYFAYVNPTGNFLTGYTGFTTWANQVHKADQLPSLLKRYLQDRRLANTFITPQGWIDATANIAAVFPHNFALDGVFYQDFYSLPTFGKTRLGTLMLYAKQSENKPLIWQTADLIRPVLSLLIDHLHIDAICYLPHSILRKTQFLKELSTRLHLPLPHIQLAKAYPGHIRVAQKTLGKLDERVANARDTIFVNSPPASYSHVLLIDDAVGSGATLNESAKKLKAQGLAKQVSGFAVVGSYKGFEVIREV